MSSSLPLPSIIVETNQLASTNRPNTSSVCPRMIQMLKSPATFWLNTYPLYCQVRMVAKNQRARLAPVMAARERALPARTPAS